MNFKSPLSVFGTWTLVIYYKLMIILFHIYCIYSIDLFITVQSSVTHSSSSSSSSYSSSYYQKKSITLSPSNSSENGASIIILNTNDVITSKHQWRITPSNQIGFHLQLHLNQSWGFHPSFPSLITITISGSVPVTMIEIDPILSFSVNNNQYITTMNRMDNTRSNLIYPPCNNKIVSPLANGNINEIVNSTNNNISRSYKSTGNGKYRIKWKPLSYPNHRNILPITYTIYNDPIHNISYFSYTNPRFLNDSESFFQDCLYSSFKTEQGLDLFFALDDNDEEIILNQFDIHYVYFSNIIHSNYIFENSQFHATLDKIYPFSIANLQNFYRKTPDILWYEGMYDRNTPNLDLTNWQYNLDKLPIAIDDYYCPLGYDHPQRTTCWKVCGPSTTSTSNNQYMYKFTSTIGYHNVSFTYSIDPFAMTEIGEFCEISYAINNNPNTWFLFMEQ